MLLSSKFEASCIHIRNIKRLSFSWQLFTEIGQMIDG